MIAGQAHKKAPKRYVNIYFLVVLVVDLVDEAVHRVFVLRYGTKMITGGTGGNGSKNPQDVHGTHSIKQARSILLAECPIVR